MVYYDIAIQAGFADGMVIPQKIMSKDWSKAYIIEQVVDVTKIYNRNSIVFDYLCRLKEDHQLISLTLNISDTGELRWSVNSHEKRLV